MKKSFFIFVVVASALFVVPAANAQKVDSFAGTVKFSVKYEGNTNPKDHAPYEQTITILGNKMKVSDPSGEIQIMDCNEPSIIFLYDYPGYKCGYTESKEVIEERFESKKFTYVKGEETMTICGYLCTRYDVTIFDTDTEEETKIIVYTTTEIGENNEINNLDYPGLTGFPLYEESEIKGVKKTEKAIEIKKTKVKAVEFLVPTAYKMFPSYMEWALFMRASFEKNKSEE